MMVTVRGEAPLPADSGTTADAFGSGAGCGTGAAASTGRAAGASATGSNGLPTRAIHSTNSKSPRPSAAAMARERAAECSCGWDCPSFNASRQAIAATADLSVSTDKCRRCKEKSLTYEETTWHPEEIAHRPGYGHGADTGVLPCHRI